MILELNRNVNSNSVFPSESVEEIISDIIFPARHADIRNFLDKIFIKLVY